MRQVKQRLKTAHSLLERPAIKGSEYPIRFQKDRGRQQEILMDRLIGQRSLNRIVAGKNPNEDVRIESASQKRFPRSANMRLTASSMSSSVAGGPLWV